MDDDRFIQRLQDLKKKRKPRFQATSGDSLILETGRWAAIKVFRLEMKMQLLRLKETVAVATPDNIFS